MKKLTVALVIVMLLTMPIVGLAEGQGNPRKPGTTDNPGLYYAAVIGNLMSGGANYWGAAIAGYLWSKEAPPWFVGN